jgi:hypothetical protein
MQLEERDQTESGELDADDAAAMLDMIRRSEIGRHKPFDGDLHCLVLSCLVFAFSCHVCVL